MEIKKIIRKSGELKSTASCKICKIIEIFDVRFFQLWGDKTRNFNVGLLTLFILRKGQNRE